MKWIYMFTFWLLNFSEKSPVAAAAFFLVAPASICILLTTFMSSGDSFAN